MRHTRLSAGDLSSPGRRALEAQGSKIMGRITPRSLSQARRGNRVGSRLGQGGVCSCLPPHVFVAGLNPLAFYGQISVGVVFRIGNQRRLFSYSTVVMISRLEMSTKSFGL